MSTLEEEIRRRLFELRDLKYKEFACKLLPTVNQETVIGVRTPELRKLAREFSKRPEVSEFLKILPHGYYEENNAVRSGCVVYSGTAFGEMDAQQSYPESG